MPITSKKHLTIQLRPYPGSRFTISGSELHIECAISKARENLNWLREWLDVNVEPEVQAIEEEAAERNKPKAMFHKGVPTNKPVKPRLPVPTIAQQRQLQRTVTKNSFEPSVPKVTPVSQKVTTRAVPPMVQAASRMIQTEMYEETESEIETEETSVEETETQETSE